jgi:multicomponent Na+:H+ antiporter subunit B
MSDVILRTAARLLLPLMLISSVFLLLTGHDAPGGGFIGGLVAAAGFALQAIAEDVDAARRLLRIDPRRLATVGLATAFLSGLVGLFRGGAFMTGHWVRLPAGGPTLGTPLLFDAGVYVLVVGVTLTIVFSLLEGD